MADSLFVIDSTFLLEASRNSFHGAPLLQDSSGRDTTMLFGFARDLLRLRKQLGMRKALVVIGDDGPCLPDSLISDAIDFLALCENLEKRAFCAGFERHLFPLRRPPKRHILARMADKLGPRCGNGAPRAG